uniref:Lipocalin n=1 Tax=Rhipicephalus appendiculatus TaxID=34631 RepID=A0A131YAV6_RHIAP
MKHLYVLVLLMHLSALVSYGQFKHGQNFTHNYQNQVKLVRKLLEQKRYLTVSRGLYSHSDYPMCVRSRFESHALAGVIHKLHYYGQESKGKRRPGKRHTIRAFIEVKAEDVPVLHISAYLAGGNVDPRVSGRYDILYAANICFIVRTRKHGPLQCLLWRRAVATERQRVPCRDAFRKLCAGYRGHTFVYTKDRCPSGNAT